MKNKKKIVIIVSIVVLLIFSISFYLYCSFNFEGTVVSKNIQEIPNEFIVFKNYEIEIDTKLEKVKYLVDNETIFDQIKIGEKYKFVRQSGLTRYVDCVDLEPIN